MMLRHARSTRASIKKDESIQIDGLPGPAMTIE
jgi:hypothetical protein